MTREEAGAIARRDVQGCLPTIHPSLLCSLWENRSRGLDSCHSTCPVIALKVHTVDPDKECAVAVLKGSHVK